MKLIQIIKFVGAVEVNRNSLLFVEGIWGQMWLDFVCVISWNQTNCSCFLVAIEVKRELFLFVKAVEVKYNSPVL